MDVQTTHFRTLSIMKICFQLIWNFHNGTVVKVSWLIGYFDHEELFSLNLENKRMFRQHTLENKHVFSSHEVSPENTYYTIHLLRLVSQRYTGLYS